MQKSEQSKIPVGVPILAQLDRGTLNNPRQGHLVLIDPERFDKHMAALAQRHVTLMKQGFNIELDYSIESLATVEESLQFLHEQLHFEKSLPIGKVPAIARSWGAYIGETIKRPHPGQWQKFDMFDDASRPLIHPDHATFPCSWAFWRIVNGPEDNIRVKYILSYETE